MNPKQTKKRTIFKRYAGKCFYCQADLTLETMTLDHHLPKSKGGANANENLRPACRPCNLKKADEIPATHFFPGPLTRKISELI